MPSSPSVLSVPLRCVSSLLFHNLALSLVVCVYVILGGLLFQSLEAGPDLKQSVAHNRSVDECLRELWLITERLNVLYERNWTHLVDAQLRKFERNVAEATRTSGYEMRKSELHWSFSGAVLYSISVVTTVGYGSTSPHTAEGKVVTMLYALVGVPLMFLCLSNLGTVFAQSFQAAYLKVCCVKPPLRRTDRHCKPVARGKEAHSTLVMVQTDCSKPVCSLTPEARQLLRKKHLTDPDKDSEDDEPDHTRVCLELHDTPSRVPLIWRAPGESRRAPTPPPRKTPTQRHSSHRVPTVVVLVVLGSYLGVGALTFASWEGWSLLDSLYFCFITLSTIGFGDMVSWRSPKTASDEQLQTVACCAYLILGLIMVAMTFSLLQEEVVSRGKHFANAIGLVKQEDLSV